MAARTRTLQQLRDGVADRGDIDVQTSGVRHTTALVDARINRAIQRWLLMVAESGDDTNLLTSRTTTSTGTTRDAANWAPNMYVAQPASCQLVRGLDIWNGSIPLAMMPIDELERDETQLASAWWATRTTGLPCFYRLGGKNANGDSLIQIFPWADGAYTVDIRYIPAHVDLVNGSDTIDFIGGGEEWVINDATIQSLLNDGLGGHPNIAQMRGDNAKLEEDLRFLLACRGGVRKVDTRGRRRLLQFLSHGPWRLL